QNVVKCFFFRKIGTLSKLLFALLPPTDSRASSRTIIYEGCVPGIQRAHLTSEVTCTEGRGMASSG
ncbi:hypothetical protein ALC56_08682, partial [Trachymyrmex septentrionalis]